MAEEGQTQSIQARIAALNLGHVGRAPITANGGKPDPPFRPSFEERSQSSITPPTLQRTSNIGNEPTSSRKNGVLPPPSDIVRTGQMEAGQKMARATAPPPPRVPARKQSTQGVPAIVPPQWTPDPVRRKLSNESLSSNVSSASALSVGRARGDHSRTASVDATSRIKAPVYDPGTLPPLPPKRVKEDGRNKFQESEKRPSRPSYGRIDQPRPTSKLSPSVETVEVTDPPPVPTLPPRRSSTQDPSLPPRKLSGQEPALPPRKSSGPEPALPPRKIPPATEDPPSKPHRSALSLGMNNPTNEALAGNEEHNSTTSESHNHSISGAPPPIPLASRPDLSKIQATKPKMPTATASQFQSGTSASDCLVCRDFSAPDNHAAKFPRHSVPSLDWLAIQLTTPFSHSPTDQARCIFTWLHHNIAYDTVSFFNNNLKPSTPASTLSTGLAVCEGYAGLFTAIAAKAGLESMVVGGHGKGYSFSPLKPGEPVPAEYSTHAWNAVKIDGGEWKLIDSCWGAGHVNGKDQPYTKHFSPRMFTMSNDEFGLRHFPTNRAHFFRSDGRQVSWEEYITAGSRDGREPVRVYSGAAETEGLSERSISPGFLHISLSSGAPTTQFSFSRVCPHWSPKRNGKGADYVYILAVNGIDGRDKDFVPFDTDGRGNWWMTVETRRLGAAGQTVSLYTVESVGGESGRGLSVPAYREAKGRKSMGFGGVAAWEIVR